jgi:hypothetical protein
MNEDSLYTFLHNLAERKFSNEIEFLSFAIPKLVSLLGYEESKLFFDVTVTIGSRRLRPDAVVANSRTSRPWLLIETKLDAAGHKQYQLPTYSLQQIQAYKTASLSQYAVLLTQHILIILQNGSAREFNNRTYLLTELTKKQADEIHSLLSRPSKLPSEEGNASTPPITRFIDTETFKLDLDVFSKMLKSVTEAKTNDEKKKSLEELAKHLLEGIPFIKCKYQNLRTRSSEIDIIAEYRGATNLTLFDDFGRYILVECKNWKASVGAAQVRDFIVKIQKTRTRLGIIFAKNGISGEKDGADAVREIHAVYDSQGIFVIVISEEDLKEIESGVSFYDILDRKIDNLRFDSDE